MALIVEDGSEVANANSYVSDSDFTTYADARGYSYPSTASAREVLLIKAMDYIASIEPKFQGSRASSTQALSFPRNAVLLYGYLLESDTIPQELKNAQMELAIQVQDEEILNNESLTSGLTGFNVQGVYSETYEGGVSVTRVITGKANAYLKHLLVSNMVLRRV